MRLRRTAARSFTSDFTRCQSRLFRTTSIALAVAVVLMTGGVASWGWFAQQYAPGDFHARNGGLFSSTNVASWTLSLAVFAAASVLALRSAEGSIADVDTARH
jgi:hypothetical protein